MTPPLPFDAPPPSLLLLLLLLLPLLPHLPPVFPPRLSQLRDKHIWIIGASRGLGHALALLCASHAARISISSRSITPSHPVAEFLKSKNRLAAVVPLDITCGWGVLEAAVRRIREVGRVDVVVLNAGVNHRNVWFERLERDDVDRVIATNLTGVIRMARLLVDVMPVGSTLCVVSSLAGYRGVCGASVYGATKAGVRVFCESLGVELGGRIKVVCVCPGFVDTEAIRGLKHSKVMMMGEKEAAVEVMRAVVGGWRVYGFPWAMQEVVMRVSRLVPVPVYERVLRWVEGRGGGVGWGGRV